MLAILSPAKTLDYESALATRKYSLPDFAPESNTLIKILRGYEPDQVSELMNISDKLALLNVERYHQWHDDFECEGARPAVLAFKGDVYIGLDAATLGERDFTFAQKHVRILSGLHGLLKPLDRIHPYRLEMGTSLPNRHGKNLYDFWGAKVTEALNAAIAAQGDRYLINLASNEYFKVVQEADIDARVIHVNFKEWKDDKLKFLSFFAKKARGTMTRYMIDKRVKTLRALKAFDYDGYRFDANASTDNEWLFTRGG
ncbi:MAG: peroxide stress protein YaaA [Pseudomonadota bacterium]